MPIKGGKMTLQEHLDSVNENLKICEDVKKEKPEYYKNFWENLHGTLLTVKKELEEKLEQSINDDLQ